MIPFIIEKEKKLGVRRQQQLEREVLEAKNMIEKAGENYAKAEVSYYKAMDELPTGWKEFGIEVSSNEGYGYELIN